MSNNRLKDIEELGQAVWLDNLHRGLLEEGTLQRLIEDDGLSGVTSNPTIFQKGMGDSDRYDDDFREATAKTDDAEEVFFQLGYKDVRGAADLLRGIFEQTGGQDGYVSFELQPSLSFDAQGSVDWALKHYERIDRENVLIKVPGTAEGVKAFEELTARGINVNVTLLFAVERYREVAEAFISGLERRAEAGEPIDRAASVASFFVSRVDTKVDKALESIGGHDELAGKAAVANAKLAYEAFQEMFSGPRWDALAAKGANVQRPLWASTSTKNPAYKDTLYVDDLIGPHTVNTMPDATIEAARDHATAERTIDQDLDEAHAVIDQLREVGVDIDDIVMHQLVDEGVKSFADSYDSLIDTIRQKAQRFAGVS
jgi:transaldolase